MKKVILLGLAVMLAMSFVACGKAKNIPTDSEIPEYGYDIKVGFVFNGDEKEAYTNAHYQAALAMKEELGLTDNQVVVKWNIPANEKAYKAAVDLADKGCHIVFANSYEHEDYLIRAAIEYPDVQFCQVGGYKASSCGLENVHNFYGDVYEARYVSGIVAGMKLNEMIQKEEISPEQAKIGYVGAYTFPEVISGYTAFYLGARSVCESVTMDVKYTGSWASISLDKESTKELIDNGCVLISHHTDTNGVALICQEEGVPFVGCHTSMIEYAPEWALTSVAIDWESYITFAVKSVMDESTIPVDWSEGYAKDVVKITELNDVCVADGTKNVVSSAENALKNGTLKVFDIATWTVNGRAVSSTATEALMNSYYGVEYIKNGTFLESQLASAPIFSFKIDGITELNTELFYDPTEE